MTDAKLAALIAEVEALPPGRFVPVQTLAHSFTREELLAMLRTTAPPADVELERLRLAACGVIALADTTDSAAKARDMHPDYWSASAHDVARRVDECIRLRAEVQRLEGELAASRTRTAELLAFVQSSPCLGVANGRGLCDPGRDVLCRRCELLESKP